jgi:macrodomain Ter protein organizer (MatP/YcbG family)
MNIISVPKDSKIKRKPKNRNNNPRPISLEKTFDEAFDWYTVFIDCIETTSSIELIGPPLSNFGKYLSIFNDNVKLKYRVSYREKFSRVTINKSQIRGKDKNLLVKIREYEYLITPRPRSVHSQDEILISTMIKNEPINWIKDWIRFHNKNYKITKFLIYDNGSTIYKSDQLSRALNDNNLNCNIIVESIPIPYGPRFDGWVDNYTQQVALEHCKHTYAWCSKMFINIDIDELLSIDLSIAYSRMLKGNLPIKLINCPVSPVNSKNGIHALELDPEEIHFKNHYNTYRNPGGCNSKWICIPRKHMHKTWKTHQCGDNSLELGRIFHFDSHTSRLTKSPEFIKKHLSRKINSKINTTLKSRLDRAFPPDDK